MDLDMSAHDFIRSLQLTEEEYILALRYRYGLKRTTLYMRRRVRDIMNNPFNIAILSYWQANIDMQPVLDEYAAATYVASYMSNRQRGMTNLLSKIHQKSFPNTTQRLKRVGAAFINASEVCAQEAVYHILALPLRRFSRVVKFVNTNFKPQ